MKQNFLELDQFQAEVVETEHKFVSVVACPGAGKTRTLRERCNYLVTELGVKPELIQVLSFANTTVSLLKDCLPSGIKVNTFHSLGMEIIRESGRNGLRLTTGKDQISMIRMAIDAVGKDCDDKENLVLTSLKNELALKELAAFFEMNATNKAVASKLFDNHDSCLCDLNESLIIDVYNEYKIMKNNRGKIDFSDMVSLAIDCLKAGVKLKFNHVLIDEYQDISPAQIRLLRVVSKKIKSVMVFCDPNQSIYGFTGYEYFDFGRVIGNNEIRKYYLFKSYRFSQRLAEAATAVMKGGKNFGVKKIKCLTEGEMPFLVDCRSQRFQERKILEIIRSLEKINVPLQQIAILGRTRTICRDAAYALRRQGVPIGNDCNETAGLKVTQIHLNVICKLMSLSLQMGKLRLSFESTNSAKKAWEVKIGEVLVGATVEDLKQIRRELMAVSSISLLGQYQIARKIYLRIFQRSEDLSVCRVLRKTLLNLQAYFHEELSLGKVKQKIAAAFNSEGVVLSTIHASKGMEWQYVILLNIVEGSLPHYRQKDLFALADERRLLYVALTRCIKNAYVLECPYDVPKRNMRFLDRSSFLSDSVVRSQFQTTIGRASSSKKLSFSNSVL